MKNKQQLLKMLGSYDDRARLNQDRITDQKKLIYTKEINLTARIDKWKQDQFTAKPFNFNFLNSVFLNNNQQFKQIKSVFAKFNEQVLGLENEHADIDHLRPKVMDSMLKFMRIVMLTEDREAQIKLLKVGHKWLMDKLDPKENYESKTDYEKQLQLRLLNKSKQQTERQVQFQAGQDVPSEQIRKQTRYYRWLARTAHSQIETPQDRLKNFKRRILNFEDPDKVKKTLPEPKKNRIKYEKPVVFLKKPTPIEEVNKEGPSQILDAIALDQANAEGKPADAIQEIAQQPQLGQQPQEQQEPQPELLEPEVGKLDPKTKNYIYLENYADLNAEHAMQERFMKNQQKLEKEVSEAQQQIKNVLSWARGKARFESEMNRKLQTRHEMATNHKSNRAFTKLQKLHTEPNEKTFDFKGESSVEKQYFQFENKINQEFYNSTKKYSGKEINVSKDEKVNALKGLSIFDRGRIKTQAQHRQPKAFSAILNEYSKEKQREVSLDEINEIKDRFAKYKINIHMNKIGEGLLHPVEMEQEELNKIGKFEVSLPNNPYFKVGKKKKKKKGKKK